MNQQLQTPVHDPETHRLGKRDPKPPHAMIHDFVDVERVSATVPANVVNSVNQTVALAMYDNDTLGDCTCFPAGTRIKMADGTSKPIEQIRVLDNVVSAEGHVRAVTSTMVRRTSGLRHVALWGHVGLRMTGEHPVLTRHGYVAAKDLTERDWVSVPRYRPTEDAIIYPEQYVKTERRIRTTGYRSWGSGDTAVKITPLPDRIVLDAEFGWLVGIFLAEGSTNQNAVRWTFGGHERETLVARTVELLGLLGADGAVKTRANGTIDVVLCGKHWRMFFEAIGNKGVDHKAMHPDLWRGSDEFLEGVLNGWLAGDGHHRRDASMGTTVSHELALNMFDIANYLGLAPTLNGRQPKQTTVKTARYRYDVGIRDTFGGERSKPKQTPQGRWRVYANDQVATRYVGTYATEAEAEAALTKFRERHGVYGNGKSELTDATTWRKVRLNEPDDSFDDFVFNLSVEVDESYIAEGIGVHNCAGVANSLRVNSDGSDQLSAQDVVNAYIAVTTEEGNAYNPQTGANADAGCAEIDVLDYWVKTGVGGDKLLAHAAVDMKNAKEVKAVAYLFGSIYPGWQLSIAQQTQQVWDVAHGADGKLGSWGGHCAPIFDIYGQWPGGTVGGVTVPAGELVTIGTWGAYKPATAAFVPWCADEGHALITDAWLARNQNNPAIDMTALDAYMKSLKPEQ